MLRYVPLLLLALFIDALQLIVELVLFIVFTVAPGTAIGTAAGAATCGKACALAGGLVGVVLDLVPYTHGALTAVTVPVGVGLGMALDICISLVAWGIFIVVLWFCGMFYPLTMFAGGLFELIPGVDLLPGWTLMVWRCIRRKIREERGEDVGTIAALVGTATRSSATASLGSLAISRLQARERIAERIRSSQDEAYA